MKKLMTKTMIAGSVALAVSSFNATDVKAMEDGHEKCYGVAKAGVNDCGNHAGTHDCAGHSTVDGHGGEWIAVPEGLCTKLVGGSLTAYDHTADVKTETELDVNVDMNQKVIKHDDKSVDEVDEHVDYDHMRNEHGQ